MPEKAVAKAEQKGLAQHNKNLLASAGGMSGFDDADLPIPLIKFVTKGSNEAILQDGNSAPVNSFFHNGRKETLNPFKFRIIAVAKGEGWSDLANQGAGGMIKKIVFFGREEDNGELFCMQISSAYGYWEFRNKVLPIFKSALKAGKNIVDVVLQGDKDSKDNDRWGKVYYPIFKLTSGSELPKDVRESLIELQANYTSKAMEMMGDSEDATEDAKKTVIHAETVKEDVKLDDVELPA